MCSLPCRTTATRSTQGQAEHLLALSVHAYYWCIWQIAKVASTLAWPWPEHAKLSLSTILWQMQTSVTKFSMGQSSNKGSQAKSQAQACRRTKTGSKLAISSTAFSDAVWSSVMQKRGACSCSACWTFMWYNLELKFASKAQMQRKRAICAEFLCVP